MPFGDPTMPFGDPSDPVQLADRAIRRHVERVRSAVCDQDTAWGRSGWTRRRFLAGAGMAGVAAFGSQLVTTRAAFAAPTAAGAAADTDGNVLVVVFMRGAADGLRILVPNSSELGLPYLKQVRPQLLPAADSLIALPNARGWALNPALRPMYDTLWSSGQLAFVPGCSTPGISRSHFQAQQYLEKGGSDTATSGWLDRVLDGLGPGTTFRAIADGSAMPLSLAGDQPSIAMDGIGDFQFPGWDDILDSSKQALATLYRNVEGTLGEDVPLTMAALATADAVRAGDTGPQNGASYPDGSFSDSLKDLAAIIRANVGMQVATVDVGGWDTHTDEAGDLDRNLASTAGALAAFMTDLGDELRAKVTVVVMTEFGRRVEMNASGGTDHGHGSVMWLLGGGLTGSGVYGNWTPLTAAALDQGDVPGVNNPFAVLGELVQKRLGIGSLSTVFNGQPLTSLGVATTR